jgi:hypothetical protein
MSVDICPTVNIKSAHASGYARINAEDFDPTKHELYVEPAPVPVGVPPPPPFVPPPGPLDGLPQNWRELPSKRLRELATAATGRTPEDKNQAVEMIEQALAAKESK